MIYQMHLILFKSEADGLNVFPKPDPPLAFPIPGILYSQTVLEHRCANLKARSLSGYLIILHHCSIANPPQVLCLLLTKSLLNVLSRWFITFFPSSRHLLISWLQSPSALISHASKVMLKILQSRLQQYVNCELPRVQAGFRKGRGTRDQISNICWIIEKAREFQKNIYFCFIDYAKPKPLTVWITINWKILKRWEYQTT